MVRFCTRLTLVLVSLLPFSTFVSAGPLDDYYLQQFGETKNVQLQKAILSASAEATESTRCGMPLKHGLKRDWNLLEQPTQKVLAKQLAAPVLTSPASYTSAGGHFTVHYATTGTDAPPMTDVSGINGIPDWVETVAVTFENVYASYGSLEYQPAPTSAGAPYDIYLLDLAPQSFYGVTTSGQSASSTNYPNAVTSWMELDNNYTDDIYKPTTYSPLQSLQITATHEYHHAVQYGYNFFFDVWYAEATSTWMEDELYDDVNQLYNYIPAWFNNSAKSLDLAVGSDAVTSGAGYGRWIFNRFLAEKHTPAIIRGVWEKVGSLSSPGSNADIPMAPVLDGVLSTSYGSSLRNEFFEFAKRVYRRDWTAHTSDTSKIHVYSPVAAYSVYPVNSTISSSKPSITLPHYSFAYYRFTPSATVPDLTITISKAIGTESAVFKKSSGGVVEISPNSDGISYTIANFSSLNKATDEVVLLLANSSSTDGNQSSFSTDGTGIINPPTDDNSSSGSSGGGCFIATAAYGSYLHPQVQLLRDFRDEYLLTNAPGRAFVALYYRCSPPLADFIARHTVLRGMTRLLLTPIVIAVAHPLISTLSLLLLTGAVLLSQLRRIRAARLNAPRHSIYTT